MYPMFDETLTTGDSLIHRIEPCHRIISAIVFSFVVALIDHFLPLLIAGIVAVVMISVARLPLGVVMRRLKVVVGFLLLLWIVLPLTIEGPVLFHIGFLRPTEPGTMLALRITLKVAALLLIFTALLATIPLTAMGHALHILKVPPKIVMMILMTYRYIYLLESEFKRALRALRIRGFIPRTNLHTYKTYAYLIGMLFVRSVARAERIEGAMRCRGFQGRFYPLITFSSPGASWTFTSLMGLITLLLVTLEYGTTAG